MTSLPAPVQSVLELFQGPLASVRFADIDAAGLAKLAAEVEAAASEVEEQENKLTELRQTLAQRQDALLTLAQQALAYARVYAENDEPLLDAVNRISLPRVGKPRKGPGAKSSATRSDATDTNAHAGVDDDAMPAADALAGDSASSETLQDPRDGDSSPSVDGDGDTAAAPMAGDSSRGSPPAAGRTQRKGRGSASQRAAN